MAKLFGGHSGRRAGARLLALAFPALLLAICAPPAACTPAAAAEGRIDKVREKIEKDEHKEKPERKRPADHHGSSSLFDDDDDDDGDGEDSLLLQATLLAFTAPFWLPPTILDDRPLPPCKPFRFEKYPYEGGARGALRMAPDAEDPERPSPVPEGRFLSFRAGYAFELDSSDMVGNRGELLVRSAARFNLDASATDYAERVDGETEHLEHYQAHLTYTFAASERALFAAGLGVRSLRFDDGYDATGVDFRYEAEFYPAKPISLQLVAEAGQVRESSARELEARAAAHLGRCEVFAGYRHFRTAGEDFAGPVLGLAVRF